MANRWNLTTNINVPNVRNFSIGEIRFNSAISTMILEFSLNGLTGVRFPFKTSATPTWRVVVRNGSADGIVSNTVAFDTTLDMILKVNLLAPGTGLATAYDTAIAAYLNSANAADREGALMTVLAGITGTVAGGPLVGQTQSIIPPGTQV